MEEYIYVLYLLIFRLSIVGVGTVSIILGYKLFAKGIYDHDKGTGLEAGYKDIKMVLRNAAPGTLFALFGIIVISVMLIKGAPERIKRSTVETMVPVKPQPNPQPATDPQPAPEPENDSNEEPQPNAEEEVVRDQPTDSRDTSTPMASSGIPVVDYDMIATRVIKQVNEEITRNGSAFSGDTKSGLCIVDANAKAKGLLEGKKKKQARDVYKANLYNLASPMNELAWIYFEEKKYDNAKGIAKIAVDLSPENPSFMDTYAHILYATKDYNGAVDYMQKAVKWAPNRSDYKTTLQKFKEMI